MVTGDDMEVRKYKRLTSLTVLNKAVGRMLSLLFCCLLVINTQFWQMWFVCG